MVVLNASTKNTVLNNRRYGPFVWLYVSVRRPTDEAREIRERERHAAGRPRRGSEHRTEGPQLQPPAA